MQKQTVKDYFGRWIGDEGQLELASLLDVQEIRSQAAGTNDVHRGPDKPSVLAGLV